MSIKINGNVTSGLHNSITKNKNHPKSNHKEIEEKTNRKREQNRIEQKYGGWSTNHSTSN